MFFLLGFDHIGNVLVFSFSTTPGRKTRPVQLGFLPPSGVMRFPFWENHPSQCGAKWPPKVDHTNLCIVSVFLENMRRCQLVELQYSWLILL